MKHHELHRKTLRAVQEVFPTSGRLQHPSSARHSHSPALQRRRITVQGIIKSVKFYAFVSALALRWNLFGFVLINANTSTGVLIEVQGLESAIESFLDALLTKAPPLAHIDAINTELLPISSEENSFEVQRKRISDRSL